MVAPHTMSFCGASVAVDKEICGGGGVSVGNSAGRGLKPADEEEGEDQREEVWRRPTQETTRAQEGVPLRIWRRI